MTATVGDRAKAVEQLEGLIKQLAKRFSYRLAHCGDHFNDLEQEGLCGALLAFDRFDPGRGVKFSTYAYAYILCSMQQYAKKHRDNDYRMAEPTGDFSASWIERIPAAFEDTDKLIDSITALSMIYGEIVNLPVVQQHVILGYYFEHKTLIAIGEEISRTRERVRQLREEGLKALKKLIRRKRLLQS